MKICACGKVMTFFGDCTKKFRKLLQIEKKTINFLCLKSDDLFWGGESIYDPDWQMCWGIIRQANLGDCKSNFLHEPPILAWASRSRQTGDLPILVFYMHISSILFILYF